MPNQLAPNSVRTYHLSPEGYAATRKILFLQCGAIFGGIGLFLLGSAYKGLGGSWRGDATAGFLPMVFCLVLVSVLLAIGLWIGMKRSRETWDSVELVIGEDFVIWRMKDYPELEIQSREVTAIKESSTGLRIETNQRGRRIGIASSLINYDDAKERLSRWMPVQRIEKGWLTTSRWILALPLIVIFLFSGFELATRSWVIVATGVPLLAVISWSAWSIHRNGQGSVKGKRLSLLMFFPLIAIVTKLILTMLHLH
jgi:protein-S-isoprenylcysteine O-methyltransferase Ste14